MPGGNRWKVLKEFVYEHAPIDVIKVPVGFVTDGGTVPPPFNAVYQNDDLEMDAFVIHDWNYTQQIRPRKECDDILLEGMKCLGSPIWRRWPIYAAVRMFGWIWWKKHKREGITLKP